MTLPFSFYFYYYCVCIFGGCSEGLLFLFSLLMILQLVSFLTYVFITMQIPCSCHLKFGHYLAFVKETKVGPEVIWKSLMQIFTFVVLPLDLLYKFKNHQCINIYHCSLPIGCLCFNLSPCLPFSQLLSPELNVHVIGMTSSHYIRSISICSYMVLF